LLNELVHEKKSDCLLLVVFRNVETRILYEVMAKFLSREVLVLVGQPGYWSRGCVGTGSVWNEKGLVGPSG
jgi:hypothetical protein